MQTNAAAVDYARRTFQESQCSETDTTGEGRLTGRVTGRGKGRKNPEVQVSLTPHLGPKDGEVTLSSRPSTF